jgi:hypothetical protein
MKTQTPLQKLRYHVTGAIERGEKNAIVEQAASTKDSTILAPASAATHAPGEWRVRSGAASTLTGFPVVEDCAGNFIAECQPEFARLIAASPRMFAMLQQCHEYFILTDGKNSAMGARISAALSSATL